MMQNSICGWLLSPHRKGEIKGFFLSLGSTSEIEKVTMLAGRKTNRKISENEKKVIAKSNVFSL